MIALLLGTALAQDLPALPPVDATGWRPEPTARQGLILPQELDGWAARADLELLGDVLDYQSPEGERLGLLPAVLRLDLGAAWGRGPFGVAATLPAVLYWQGAEAQGRGLGDPALDLRWCPLPGRPLGLRFDAGGSLPLGGAASATGEDGPTGQLGVLLDGRAGPLRLGGQVQARFRQAQEIPGATLDDQLVLRAGISMDLAPRSWVSWEGQAATDLAAPWTELAASPVELVLGAGHRLPGGTAVRVGAGLGPVGGVGAPAWRLLLGLGQEAPRTSP